MTSLLLATALSLCPAQAAGPAVTPQVVLAAPAKAQVYQWPADAAPVRFVVTADVVSSLVDSVEAFGIPGAPPEVSAAALEVLRRPFVVTWDLAQGVATAPAVDVSTIPDPVRAGGLTQMYDGMLEMVQGIALSVRGGQAMAVAVAAGTVKPRTKRGKTSYTFPDGTLVVDRATGLPAVLEVRAADVQVDLRYEGWQALDGADRALSRMTAWELGAAEPTGIYELTWARSGDVWLPRTIAVTTTRNRVVLELAPVM